MSVEAKAGRLLSEGRVWVVRVDRDEVVAHVEGDHDPHIVEHQRHRGWSCTCQAFTFRHSCSHQLATELVTTRRRT